MRIYFNFDLINVNDTHSLRMLNFANSTVGYENWYCFVSIKFDVERKRIISRNFASGVTKFMCQVFSKSRIQYLWQGEISVCKVLVPIKVVPVNNDCFLHPKLELHRYQQMNLSFCIGENFNEKDMVNILVTSSLSG